MRTWKLLLIVLIIGLTSSCSDSSFEMLKGSPEFQISCPSGAELIMPDGDKCFMCVKLLKNKNDSLEYLVPHGPYIVIDDDWNTRELNKRREFFGKKVIERGQFSEGVRVGVWHNLEKNFSTSNFSAIIMANMKGGDFTEVTVIEPNSNNKILEMHKKDENYDGKIIRMCPSLPPEPITNPTYLLQYFHSCSWRKIDYQDLKFQISGTLYGRIINEDTDVLLVEKDSKITLKNLITDEIIREWDLKANQSYRDGFPEQ
jgi:hypothetical protein